MAIQRFIDIVAWQKAQDFAVEIHNTFDATTDSGFKDQIFWNATSISNFIAEGFEVGNSLDFIKALNNSLEICCVIKSMLHLSVKLGYIDDATLFELSERTDEMSRTLKRLIQSYKPKS